MNLSQITQPDEPGHEIPYCSPFHAENPGFSQIIGNFLDSKLFCGFRNQNGSREFKEGM